MNHAKTTLVASLLALLAASVWSAQAPLDADALKEAATNIASGTVSEVAVTTQKTKLKSERGLFNRDRVYRITVKVATVSHGSDVKPGEEITIAAWKAHRRPLWHAGPQGYSNIPKKGDTITVYVRGKDGNTYIPIRPNGIAIDDKDD